MKHDHKHIKDVVINIKKDKKRKKHSTNVKGLLLHILGDALGSVAVIISALCIK